MHIDIDNSELNKNKLVKLPILSDLKYVLDRANRILERWVTSVFPTDTRSSGISRSIAGRQSIRCFKDTEDVIQPRYGQCSMS